MGGGGGGGGGSCSLGCVLCGVGAPGLSERGDRPLLEYEAFYSTSTKFVVF